MPRASTDAAAGAAIEALHEDVDDEADKDEGDTDGVGDGSGRDAKGAERAASEDDDEDQKTAEASAAEGDEEDEEDDQDKETEEEETVEKVKEDAEEEDCAKEDAEVPELEMKVLETPDVKVPETPEGAEADMSEADFRAFLTNAGTEFTAWRMANPGQMTASLSAHADFMHGARSLWHTALHKKKAAAYTLANAKEDHDGDSANRDLRRTFESAQLQWDAATDEVSCMQYVFMDRYNTERAARTHNARNLSTGAGGDAAITATGAASAETSQSAATAVLPPRDKRLVYDATDHRLRSAMSQWGADFCASQDGEDTSKGVAYKCDHCHKRRVLVFGTTYEGFSQGLRNHRHDHCSLRIPKGTTAGRTPRNKTATAPTKKVVRE